MAQRGAKQKGGVVNGVSSHLPLTSIPSSLSSPDLSPRSLLPPARVGRRSQQVDALLRRSVSPRSPLLSLSYSSFSASSPSRPPSLPFLLMMTTRRWMVLEQGGVPRPIIFRLRFQQRLFQGKGYVRVKTGVGGRGKWGGRKC